MLLDYFPENIKSKLMKGSLKIPGKIQEIRLTVNSPPEVITTQNRFFINHQGKKIKNVNKSEFRINKQDIERAVILLSDNSVYALERQLREGFITLPGGHRVGFTGEVVTENRSIKTIKNINSLNYRFTREVTGPGSKIFPHLLNKNREFVSTLIISPPLCGKTTLLRDLVRVLSEGVSAIGYEGVRVGVVDERSEIGGAYRGVSQNDLGPRTDLLDNCPKSEGMMLLIRSMSPQVIAVDEIGGSQEITALREAVRTGVRLLATIHGSDVKKVQERPGVKYLFEKKLFERFIVLSRKQGPGTVESIKTIRGKELWL